MREALGSIPSVSIYKHYYQTTLRFLLHHRFNFDFLFIGGSRQVPDATLQNSAVRLYKHLRHSLTHSLR